uniref:Uncharacterized protein n=1 Tax=Arundo donax TaxID=35708 RepID=A0A0A9CIK6_ARUDO
MARIPTYFTNHFFLLPLLPVSFCSLSFSLPDLSLSASEVHRNSIRIRGLILII